MKAAYLGIDVGSISTNLVLVDDSGRVLHKKYLRTHGQPMKAMQRPLFRRLNQQKKVALHLKKFWPIPFIAVMITRRRVRN